VLHLCSNLTVAGIVPVKKHTMDLKRIHLERVDSTNSWLSRLQRQGKGHIPVVLTSDYQSGGRGRGPNGWDSEEGRNLLMSVLLFPAFLSAPEQFRLARMVSLAICEMLGGLGLSPLIKWPNDILAGQGKIAGILIENSIIGNSLSHTIIGMGINLNQEKFPEFPLPATSLVREGRPPADREAAAKQLEGILLGYYSRLEQGEGFEKAYLNRLYGLNRPLRFRTGDRIFEGIIRGTDDRGELRVETEEGIRTFLFGEITYIMDGFPRERES
jgi:BirA family biotin operon repressor/biotin-[acetyl-CoA-carboxylase] ligase